MMRRGWRRTLPQPNHLFQLSQPVLQRCTIFGTSFSLKECLLKVSLGWMYLIWRNWRGPTPPMELSVTSYLHPNCRALSFASPSLPGWTERLFTSLLLICLGSQLSKQHISAEPDSALWEQICVFADLNLRSSRGAVQTFGHSMGFTVVSKRSLWLGLSGLWEREKA